MEIKQVTVIGSGLMGSGIAQVIATAGFRVNLFDSYPEALDKGRSGIEKSLARLVKAGRMKSEDQNLVMERIMFYKEMEPSLKGSQLVIEAVPEIPELKEEVFNSVEKFAEPDAVLATNTSFYPLQWIWQV